MTFHLQLSEALEIKKSNISSPYSIAVALNLLKIGLQGPSKAALDALAIDKVPMQYPGLANAIYYREVEQSYLDKVSNIGEVYEYKSVGQVNSWVSKATQGEIDKLFDSLSPPPQLVVCNAIYFKSDWRTPFDPSSTYTGEFHGVNGTVKQQFMAEKLHCFYLEKQGKKYTGLPYNNGSVFIMRLGTESEAISPISRDLASNKVEVTVEIPKFKTKTEIDMRLVATKLGLGALFDVSSDFSPILGGPGAVSQFVHKAVIEVDEHGSVAAATTGISVMRASFNPNQLEFIADKPFRYWIYDQKHDLVLFEGIFDASLQD